MLAVADQEEQAFISFAVNTGFRIDEIAHAEITDVDFERGTVRTSPKPHMGWMPKNKEARTIEVPDSLLGLLRALNRKSGLIFPTKDGKVNRHLDRIVRAVAARAGVTLPKKPCHAFRVLFACNLSRNHVDIETIRVRMGHADIATTQMYLRSVDIDRQTVNSIGI